MTPADDTRVHCTLMHITSHKSPCVVEGWGVSDNFLRLSSHSPDFRQEVSRPDLVQTSADVAAVPGLSSFGAGWPALAPASRHRLWHVWSQSQSLSDSQTTNRDKQRQTPTRLLQTDIPRHSAPPHFHQLDKYGLAESETRWCNSHSRASSSLTFKSEHDYLKVRPHHSLDTERYRGRKTVIKNVWGSGRGRQFYA